MNYRLLISKGSLTPSGFSVTDLYVVGKNHPDWSWKTKYERVDADHLKVTAYNITQNGKKAKAVDTKYVRQTLNSSL